MILVKTHVKLILENEPFTGPVKSNLSNLCLLHINLTKILSLIRLSFLVIFISKVYDTTPSYSFE